MTTRGAILEHLVFTFSMLVGRNTPPSHDVVYCVNAPSDHPAKLAFSRSHLLIYGTIMGPVVYQALIFSHIETHTPEMNVPSAIGTPARPYYDLYAAASPTI